MVVISPGWSVDVERGPDWLIVTPHCDRDHEWENPQFAVMVWELLEQHFTYRVVLDLSTVYMLHTALVGQLVYLQKRISAHGGVMRICGLTEKNHDILRTCRLDGFLPHYHDRVEAVQGIATPMKPR